MVSMQMEEVEMKAEEQGDDQKSLARNWNRSVGSLDLNKEFSMTNITWV